MPRKVILAIFGKMHILHILCILLLCIFRISAYYAYFAFLRYPNAYPESLALLCDITELLSPWGCSIFGENCQIRILTFERWWRKISKTFFSHFQSKMKNVKNAWKHLKRREKWFLAIFGKMHILHILCILCIFCISKIS